MRGCQWSCSTGRAVLWAVVVMPEIEPDITPNANRGSCVCVVGERSGRNWGWEELCPGNLLRAGDNGILKASWYLDTHDLSLAHRLPSFPLDTSTWKTDMDVKLHTSEYRLFICTLTPSVSLPSSLPRLTVAPFCWLLGQKSRAIVQWRVVWDLGEMVSSLRSTMKGNVPWACWLNSLGRGPLPSQFLLL